MYRSPDVLFCYHVFQSLSLQGYPGKAYKAQDTHLVNFISGMLGGDDLLQFPIVLYQAILPKKKKRLADQRKTIVNHKLF